MRVKSILLTFEESARGADGADPARGTRGPSVAGAAVRVPRSWLDPGLVAVCVALMSVWKAW